MRYLQKLALIILPAVMMAMPGCGSSSNGSAAPNDPFSGGLSSPVQANGSIMFTDSAGLVEGGQSNMLKAWTIEDVDPAITPSVAALQLLPFKVTDSEGKPRKGVPITLSVYSITSLNPDDVTIDFLVPPVTEPKQRTITTDSAGMGIFNIAVVLKSPPIGSFTSSSVVFKAITSDPAPVTAYVGGSYSITAKKQP